MRLFCNRNDRDALSANARRYFWSAVRRPSAALLRGLKFIAASSATAALMARSSASMAYDPMNGPRAGERRSQGAANSVTTRLLQLCTES